MICRDAAKIQAAELDQRRGGGAGRLPERPQHRDGSALMGKQGHQGAGTVTASIDDTAGGIWLITTETGSRYEIDLDHRTLRRHPGTGTLRRDWQDVTLHQVVECRVGTSAGFLICVEPGVVTLRMTSHVTHIEPVPLTNTAPQGSL